MPTEQRDTVASAVPEAEARAELDRLLSDNRFHATERAASVLRYLVDRRFSGDDHSAKAYEIAIDVLGRPSNFDSTMDPIVRIELSRIRSALNQYYEAYGSETSVELRLPRGRYVAEFRHTRGCKTDESAGFGGEASDEAIDKTDTVATDQPVRLPLARRGQAAIAALFLALIAAAVGGLGLAFRAINTEKPIVTVTMTAAADGQRGEASLTRDMLLTALTQFQTLRVVAGSARHRTLADELRPSVANTYAIDMKYYSDGDDRSVWWQITDTRSGDLLTSGVQHVDAKGKTEVVARTELAAMLSRRFAAARSAINNIETHGSVQASIGNACVLRAEYELDEGGAAALADAASCLERTIAADPNDADAAATLSRILLAQHAETSTTTALGRSLELANRAVALAPISDRAHIALMTALFYSGRTEAAISAGNRALSLNPNNPDVSAKLAMVLFNSGYWDAGVSLAEDAARDVDAVPREATLVLALDAYRRGDWSGASLLAEQLNHRDFDADMLKVAALAQLGSNQVAVRLGEVQQREPDFESTFDRRMAWRRYSPQLTASIQAGLAKAGAQFNTESLASAR
jgi:tetratricopeptide (TPR) repeat protein